MLCLPHRDSGSQPSTDVDRPQPLPKPSRGHHLTLIVIVALATLWLSELWRDKPPTQAHAAPANFNASTLQATLQLQTQLTTAVTQTERSVVAIARIRKDNSVFDGSRVAPPVNRVITPTDPAFIPNEFATGVVVDANGLILTNYHVLGDPAENYYWVWIQQKPYKVVSMTKIGRTVAGDPWTDLALLKIEATNLTPIRLGDGKRIRKGQIVMALGNPYAIARDGQASVSWGIVSNLSRPAARQPKSLTDPGPKETLHHYGTLIQTDARLNLGTSGGALINLKGEMIGLTTAQAALTGYESPAGFAIPVDDTFRRVLRNLKAGKRTDFGFLGVAPTALSAAARRRGRRGALVSQIVPGTPAHRAGIKAQDVITHVDNVPVTTPRDLSREIGRLPALASIEVKILRGQTSERPGRPRRLQVALSKQFVELQGPAYSLDKPKVWRGVQVDYATAIPPSVMREKNHLIDPAGCVVVRTVTPDSPAFGAGLRADEFISHVNNRRVRSPQEFFTAVNLFKGRVTLRLTSAGGATKVIPAQ